MIEHKYRRDKASNAVLNNDVSALSIYKQKKKMFRKQKEQEKNIHDDINSMKERIKKLEEIVYGNSNNFN